MKTLSNLAKSVIIFSIFLIGCVKIPTAFVETGKIENFTFKNSRAFNPVDTDLGIINDSCKLINNAFKINENYYVFENGFIPPKVLKMGKNKILNAINEAQWGAPQYYKLSNDALICKIGWVFHTRQNEDSIAKYKSQIFGHNIYKIKDEIHVEDYSVFPDYHNRLIGKTDSIDLFNILKISKKEYSVDTGRGNLIFNEDTGYFDLEKSTVTPNGEFDKVKIFPMDKTKKSYIFRFLYYKHKNEDLVKYFEGNYVKKGLEADWKNHLKNNVYTNFFPQFIEGYNCKCNLDLKSGFMPTGAVSSYSPPLPLTANSTTPSDQ